MLLKTDPVLASVHICVCVYVQTLVVVVVDSHQQFISKI